MDMQMMVEQQGEVLNTVEHNADDTVVQLNEGNTQLSRAIALAKSTRAVNIRYLIY
jgi:syntaxin 1B/2/3